MIDVEQDLKYTSRPIKSSKIPLPFSHLSIYLIFECIALRSVTQLDMFTQQLSNMYTSTFLIVFRNFPSKYISLAFYFNIF